MSDPANLLKRMGADVLARCARRWASRQHELGPCLVWTHPQVWCGAVRCSAVRRHQPACCAAETARRGELARLLGRVKVIGDKRRGGATYWKVFACA